MDSANTAQNTNQAVAATDQTGSPATPPPAATADQNTPAPAAGKEAAPSAVENKNASEQSKTPTEQKPSVPEKYELKLSEGSKLSASDVEEIETFAKSKGFTNEQAQEYLAGKEAAVSSYAEREQKNLEQLNDVTWKQELMQDVEFGGKDFEANGHLAERAANAFFGEGFAADLKAMKLNHNPKLFRGLVRIAKAMQDDKLVLGGAGPTTEKSMAEVFYGKTS